MSVVELTREARARLSCGGSAAPIYEAVRDVLSDRHSGGGTLLDVGCGTGTLWRHVRDRFDRYVGTDIVRYDGLPHDAEFHAIDLDTGRIPMPDQSGDAVTAVETIEHLENPRAFARELVRLCKPGGWVVITTPNQLSLLSKLTLVAKNEFNAFRAGNYPAHLTALLEIDLRRIGCECGLTDIDVRYTASGRVPGTACHYPRLVSRLSPRLFSDNVLLVGRRPAGSCPGHEPDSRPTGGAAGS